MAISKTAFVSGALIGGLVLGLAGGANAAQVNGPKVQWNFSMWGTPRAATVGFEHLAKLVSEATDGNFTIKIHYGGALSEPKENLDGVAIGAFEMSLVATGFVPGKLPVADGCALPMLPTPTVHHTRVVRETFYKHPDPNRELTGWQSVLIMPMPFGANEFAGKGEPPLTLDGWKGKRVRALSGDAKAMKALGAVPQNLPTPEAYGALERGLLDAASSGYYSIQAFRWHELTDWYTTNMALSSAMSVVPATKKAYDALPPQYKKLLMDKVPASLDAWEKAYTDADLAALEVFKKKGMRGITYSPADLAKLDAAARPIWNEWVADVTKKGYKGKELLDLMLATAKTVKTS
ncbi:MAG: TRAP transporter substrate-binding protein DctP [Alphaproteobacteria bacterium]